MAVLGLFGKLRREQPSEFETAISIRPPIGGQKLLTLSDGSQIELNTNTALRINVDSHRRTVTLERAKPIFRSNTMLPAHFVVTAADHKVTDLGRNFFCWTSGTKLEGSAC